MKLSKQQVEAIASRVRKNVIDPINKYNNAIRNSAHYINFENVDRDCIELKALLDRHEVSYQVNQIISKIKSDYFKDKFIQPPSFGYDNIDIINDIVLGTIEHDNLDELISSLTEKYGRA